MDTLAESLLLLTKVKSKVVDKIKELDNKIDSIVLVAAKTVKPQTVTAKQKTTQPTTIVKADAVDKTIVRTVEKPKTVIISDFTKEALNDLAGILGSKQVKAASGDGDKPEKSKSGMKVLGWLAAAAATYAVIKNFKVENIPGLISGLQKARKSVIKLTTKMKTGVNSIKNGIKNVKSFFTKSTNALKKLIPKNLKALITKSADAAKAAVKNLGSKIGSVADDAINGLKSQMDNVATKMGTFAKNLGTGLKSITSKVGSMAGLADDGAKSLAAATTASAPKAAPPKKASFFSRAKSTVSNVAGKAKGAVVKGATAVSNVASKAKDVVVKGATAVGNVAGKAKDVVVKGATAVKKGGVAVAKKTFKAGVKAFGGAAKVGKMVLKSPFLAPIVEGIFTYKDITKAIAEYKQGEIDKKELDKKVGTRAIKGIGGIIGAAAGGTLGAAALGTLSFGLAGPIGAIIGGIGGDMAGRFLGGVIADVIGDKTDTFGKGIVDSKFFKNKMIAEPSDQGSSTPSEGKESLDSALAYSDSAEGLLNPQEASRRVSAAEDPYNSKKPVEIEDGIITKAGKLIKPHKEDFLYAMKDGGPLANAMSGDNKAAEKNNEILEQFKSLTKNLSIKQIELMEMNNKLLKSIQGSLNEPSGSQGGTMVTSNNSNTTNVNFKSPGLRDIQLNYG